MTTYDGDERYTVDVRNINNIFLLAISDVSSSDVSHLMVFYDPFGHSNHVTLRGLVLHIRSAGDPDSIKRLLKFEAKWYEFDVCFQTQFKSF
jgi:hypothetical protein